MSQETELQQLYAEIGKIKDSMKKTMRRSTIGLLILVFVTLISLVYAFVKNVEATKNAEEANRQRILAEQARAEADMNAQEASKQREIANEQRKAAELSVKLAREALENCRKGKK